MQRIEKPWGYEIIWAATNSYVGKLLHINAGHRLSKQYHMIKEETVYVTKGTLYNYEDDGTITKVTQGNSLHINVGQIHRFGANESNVEVIEVSTPYLEDVVRLEDDYDRKTE
jgi:mannose-6-phosphate isomerase|tara:strand:- start:118 stop:456 length:339 start_codon:yes stop_codon:yes gene_type:complete